VRRKYIYVHIPRGHSNTGRRRTRDEESISESRKILRKDWS